MATMRNEATPVHHARATPRDWLGLAVLALPCLLYSMDLTVLNLAMPQIAQALAPSPAELLWIVDIYGFVLAGALITMGAIGDRYGRRRVLLIGALAFGGASVFAVYASSVPELIAGRALLGLAAAALAPSTLSLVAVMFRDPEQRGVAIAVWIASFSAGGAIGPLVGGLLLEHFWWGSVFLINLPVMALLLICGPAVLPEHRDSGTAPPDLPSVLMSIAAILLVVFAIKEAASVGVDTIPVASLVAGLVVAWLFVRRQTQLNDPFLDLALLRSAGFVVALLVNLLGFLVAFGSFFLIAQYLQGVLRLSPLHAGLWTAPSGVAFVAGALGATAMAARLGRHRLVALSLGLAACGFVVLGIAGVAMSLPGIVTGYVLFSLGLAPVFASMTEIIVSAAPPDRAGIAAGLSETSSELGGALGIAMLGSLALAVFQAASPSDGGEGETITSAARSAWGMGFSMSMWVAAGISLALAAAAARILRPTAV
jgi:MFS transporter, DHA2 family, multidrug resistance protein